MSCRPSLLETKEAAMNFLLTFPTTCAAVYLLRKPIKRWPVVFYLCAIALDTLYLASGFIVLPRWLWGILVELVQRCELALALFAIVMLIGCLDSTSRLHRRLSPIRGELSIIAWILAMEPCDRLCRLLSAATPKYEQSRREHRRLHGCGAHSACTLNRLRDHVT